jgi:sugar/nucleoside kinase (ribokinase family)
MEQKQDYDVVSFGMINCDVPLGPVPHDLMEHELCRIGRVAMTTGGDAMNVACTLGILGARTAVVGRIGRDAHGELVTRVAISKGVDTSFIVYDDCEDTSTSYLLFESNGSQHYVSSSLISANLSSRDLPNELLDRCSVLYFGSCFAFEQMDRGGIADAFQRAHDRGVLTAMDTSIDVDYPSGNAALEVADDALRQTDIFIPSLSEIAFLSGGETDPHKLASMMKPYGMRIFGVKLGEKGCYLTDFRQELYISPFAGVEARDCTGAGDSFFGAFLRGWTLNWSLEQCGLLAVAVSGMNVTKIGATNGVPDFQVALAFLRDNEARIERREYSSR